LQAGPDYSIARSRFRAALPDLSAVRNVAWASMIRTVTVIPTLFVLLWATGFIGARYAMPWAEPFTFLTVRNMLTLALLAALALVMGAKRLAPRDALMAAVGGMLMHGVYLGGIFWAIDNGMPAGLSALVIGLQPLITAVMAGTFLGEEVLKRHWVGLAVGFAGVVLVVAPTFIGHMTGVTAATFGACVLAVFAMSAGTIWQKRFVSGADMLTGTMWQYLGGALLMALLSFGLETQSMSWNGELVFALLWLVLVLSIGAIFLLMYLIREGAMARVGSLFYLVPAATAFLAWLLFGERLSAMQVAGMAVVTVGVALATQPTARVRASV